MSNQVMNINDTGYISTTIWSLVNSIWDVWTI